MAKEVFEKEKSKIFIKITLYLLLALAFFSNYWVDNSVGPLIFIFGILTLIPLTIIYTQEGKRIWSYFWMIPFISLVLFNLTHLYGTTLGISTTGGLCGFVWMGERIFRKFINMQSLWAIIFFMLIFWMIIKIKNLKSRFS